MASSRALLLSLVCLNCSTETRPETSRSSQAITQSGDTTEEEDQTFRDNRAGPHQQANSDGITLSEEPYEFTPRERLIKVLEASSSAAIVRCRTASSRYDGAIDPERIVTQYDFDLIESIIGQAPSSATLRGGVIGDVISEYTEQPLVTPGNEYIAVYAGTVLIAAGLRVGADQFNISGEVITASDVRSIFNTPESP